MKKMNAVFSKMFMRVMVVIAFALATATSSFAQGGATSSGVFNPLGQSSAGGAGMGMRLPLIVGGSFGIGSGAGVGNGSDVGLCSVRPMIGAWIPGIAFLRLGYGFSSYEEQDDDKKNEVETSSFSVDLGTHLFSEFYLTGSYSRVSALSANGDIAWNEWSVGFGTFWFVFSRTLLTLDFGYHWVRKHYDPFVDRDVSGGRMQMNIGFAVFVY
ncbi:hypothetical protein SAMN05720759_104108 [Fibrobacter sp. UWB12]|nr:hypothetical protein SAMN05720759_104108 [Fibrobacter sp. UWB12]